MGVQELHQIQSAIVLLLFVQRRSCITAGGTQSQGLFTHNDRTGFKVDLFHEGNINAANQLVNQVNGRLVAQLLQIHSQELQNGICIDLGRILDQTAADVNDLVGQLLIVADHADCVQILHQNDVTGQSIGCAQHFLLSFLVCLAHGQIQRICHFHSKGLTGIGLLQFISAGISITGSYQGQIIITCDDGATVGQVKGHRDPNSLVNRICVSLGGNGTALLIHRDQIILFLRHQIRIGFIRTEVTGSDNCDLFLAQPIKILLDEHAKRHLTALLCRFAFSSVNRQQRSNVTGSQHHKYCQEHRQEALALHTKLFHSVTPPDPILSCPSLILTSNRGKFVESQYSTEKPKLYINPTLSFPL